MRGKPPYYLEADALITCIEHAAYYSRATKYPLIVYCDQAALQWIKTASKGAVTAWRIERLNGLNYEVKYKPGKINVVADALSRYPMIGPRQLSRTGIAAIRSTSCSTSSRRRPQPPACGSGPPTTLTPCGPLCEHGVPVPSPA